MFIRRSSILSLKSILGATALGFCLATPAAAQQSQIINIGTASINGFWYASAGFICDVVQKTQRQLGHQVRCTVEVGKGSVANLRGIREGHLTAGYAQSDWQYHSYRGSNVFQQEGANQDLRFLMAIQADPLHLVVRRDSGIRALDDIRGKRVNTGNPGSGTEATNYQLFGYMKLDPKRDFRLESKLDPREQAAALCDNKIDAYFIASGQPASLVEEATNVCDAAVVPLTGPAVDKLLADSPYFVRHTIGAGVYRGQSTPVATFAIPTTIVASEKNLSAEAAYYMVKAVFDNFEEFKSRAAAFALLTREGSANGGRSIPHHPGALKYYKEVGLVK